MQRLSSRLARISLHPSEVSTACRAAALAFLEPRPWSKRELADWLVGAYQYVTLRGHGGGVAPKNHGAVSRESVVELVERVRDEVRDALDHVLTGDAGFVEELVQSGAVAPLKLPTGHEIHVAMNHRSLRLADRVLSLFAADYLMRRNDYRTKLTVCDDCHQVTFAGECRHPQSGVFLSRNALTARTSMVCTIEVDDDDDFDDTEEIAADDIIVLESLAS